MLHLLATDRAKILFSDLFNSRIGQALDILHSTLQPYEIPHFLCASVNDQEYLADKLYGDPIGGTVDGEIG